MAKSRTPDRSAADFIPPRPTLRTAKEAAKGCRGCDLYRNATQTVFGAGSANADIVLVGEQPGDQEDKQGEPFVGPAGRVLDQALERAGIVRDRVYVTNVVKHFKWEPRGKRRIHKKPDMAEIAACRPWLELELALVKPRAVMCLGATAAQALLGGAFRVTRDRGRPVASPLAPVVMATIHPSSILRAPDDETRRAEFERFVEDLESLVRAMGAAGPGA